jgi:hypothetical protein
MFALNGTEAGLQAYYTFDMDSQLRDYETGEIKGVRDLSGAGNDLLYAACASSAKHGNRSTSMVPCYREDRAELGPHAVPQKVPSGAPAGGRARVQELSANQSPFRILLNASDADGGSLTAHIKERPSLGALILSNGSDLVGDAIGLGQRTGQQTHQWVIRYRLSMASATSQASWNVRIVAGYTLASCSIALTCPDLLPFAAV